MAQYMWCANHSFSSMEDLKKHLDRDEKVFMSILPTLKQNGLTDSKRGSRVNKKANTLIKVF